MKKLLFSLLIAISLFSCEKYPEPGYETMEIFNFYIIGNLQSAEEQNYVPMEIGAQIDLNSLLPQKNNQFKLQIAIKSGGGSVDNALITADSEGRMVTNWKLGNESNEQILSCQIVDTDNNLYSEFEIDATAFFMNEWNEIKKGYLVGIDDMVSDTSRQRSMIFNEGQIWVLKDEFYSWEPKGWSFNTYVRFIDMTTDGTVFAAGWNGALYKTEDWGDNWQYVCHPFPENQHFYNFNITSDDYLWATKNSFGVYCSKDKGLTWEKDTTERIKDSYLGPIYKYQNSYMTIADWPLSIVQKQDSTAGWHDISTPEYSLSMYIPNDSTIIAQNQGGFKLHKSTDDGQTFKQVFAPYTEMGGGDLWHVYNKFGNDYFVMAPSNGLWHTKDFEEFEQLISISTYQSKVFIDHTGTIYIVGSNFVNAEDEASYILPHIP
jgi:hypothetical protein